MPHRLAVFVLVAVLSSTAWPHGTFAQSCGDAPQQDGGLVRAVVDARTLALEDGRQVVLAGIEVPEGAESSAQATQAQGTLAQLLGHRVTLRHAGGTDRYGRLRAFVISPVSGLEGPVQHGMVMQGFARAASQGVGSACVTELLAREREARAAKRGLWADSQHAVRQANDPASILAARGRMAIVEGQVLSVRESGGTIYVNFGRRWSQDFTVTIAKRNETTFTTGGLPPKLLEQRQVRVRGWVEERGGPWIEATQPEQFELLGPQETRQGPRTVR